MRITLKAAKIERFIWFYRQAISSNFYRQMNAFALISLVNVEFEAFVNGTLRDEDVLLNIVVQYIVNVYLIVVLYQSIREF